MLDTFDARQSSRRTRNTRRIRRTLAAAGAVVAAAALSAPGIAAAEVGGSSPLRPHQPLIATGTGKVTDKMPFCFSGAPGPCGWFVEGTHRGTPIRSGTFFAMIDDEKAASARRCVPATYSGLLYESADDYIAHVAEGRVCPDHAGGYVFTGRFDGPSGFGRFREVSSGRGRILVTLPAHGSVTIAIGAHLRVG